MESQNSLNKDRRNENSHNYGKKYNNDPITVIDLLQLPLKDLLQKKLELLTLLENKKEENEFKLLTENNFSNKKDLLYKREIKTYPEIKVQEAQEDFEIRKAYEIWKQKYENYF